MIDVIADCTVHTGMNRPDFTMYHRELDDVLQYSMNKAVWQYGKTAGLYTVANAAHAPDVITN